MDLKPDDGTPRHFAVLLYRQWEAIDVMGPLEALNTLSRNIAKGVEPFVLDIITPNGEPAHSGPDKNNGKPSAIGWRVNQTVVGTHGYHYNSKDPEADLLKDVEAADVLIVPGGMGPPDDEVKGVIEFIRQYYNKFLKGKPNKTLFTVCTGSRLAAAAGCLDHIYATTNKAAWKWVTEELKLDKTYWVADARWVDQGAIWTTSGVSSGTDGFIAWMTQIYGAEITKKVTDGMEWNVMPDSRRDPFFKQYSCKDAPGKSGLPKCP